MKKLAIIGAGYLQKPLVIKAKELGIETHVFAWDEGAVCKSIADFFYPVSILEKEKILEKCKEIKIDGITSIASDAAVQTTCFVAGKMGLLSNLYTDTLAFTNKFAMRQRFSETDIKSPHYIIADGNFSVEDLKFPLIVKPTDRSGSLGVQKVENRTDIENAVKRAKEVSFGSEAIIEEFISGDEVSVETITWEGKHYIITITDKVTTGEPYFVELQHHQPTKLNVEIQNKIKELTLKSLNSLGVKYGASHTELKITESGEVYVIEVGARMGGDFIGSDLVRLSTGYDFVKGVIDVAFGHFKEPEISLNKCAGVYFLSKESANVRYYIENSSDFSEIIKSEITSPDLLSVRSSSDRSGYFIYQSDQRMQI